MSTVLPLWLIIEWLYFTAVLNATCMQNVLHVSKNVCRRFWINLMRLLWFESTLIKCPYGFLSTYKVNSPKTHSVTILPVPTNCTWQWANFTAFLLTYWFSIWTLMGVFTSSYSYCNISSKSVFIFMLCCILTLNTQNFSATGESSKKSMLSTWIVQFHLVCIIHRSASSSL